MQMKPTSLTLSNKELELLTNEGERRGLNKSAMLRLIISEWQEMKHSGVKVPSHIGELPHPIDAEPIRIAYVSK